MTRWVLVAVLVSLVLAPMAPAEQQHGTQRPTGGFGVPADPQNGPRIRSIDPDPSTGRSRRPIDSEIRPDDEVVEIVDWQPAGMLPPLPEGITPFEFRIREASAVATVTVMSVTSVVAPDRRAISSSVRALVTRVLKSPPTGTISEGREVTFTTGGGEVVLETHGKQVTVRTGRLGDLPFSTGVSYLVLLDEHDGGWWAVRSSAAEISQNVLRPLSTRSDALFRGRRDLATALDAVTKAVSR